uniref:Neprosin PEP catalytic domain-containing protein n=1 Tax=Ananas comosus var. bracteatus TaxID=296719 RepID=A0A6V7PTK0_ANACO|nr:unnamed protein product [Ananas comosus var. bracteatus]
MDCTVKAALLSLVLCVILWISCIEAKRWRLTEEEDANFERQLKILNKPYVKSYKVANGDIIDCVDIYKQPAFDHPLLKNHTLQNAVNGPSENGKHEIGVKESCPEGYVPIRRTQKEDLIRAKKYARHLQFKRSNRLQKSENRTGNHVSHLSLYAILGWFGGPLRFYGAEALMDVFNLPGVVDDQFSSAQIILEKGDGGPEDYINTIQFGWDSDDYQKTGCFNQLCPGYVQISQKFFPGGVLQPGRGAIKFTVLRDPYNLNWYLLTGTEVVGYFPKQIFNNMADSDQVEMGGIVHKPESTHFSPPMGNGAFPDNARSACEYKQIVFFDGAGNSYQPRSTAYRYHDVPNFYGLSDPKNYSGDDGYTFQFGGPGGYIYA